MQQSAMRGNETIKKLAAVFYDGRKERTGN